jgi:hypothetical protein
MGVKMCKSTFRFRQFSIAASFALILISVLFHFPTHASETPNAKPGARIDQMRDGQPQEMDELQLQALVMGMADEYASVISEIVYLELRPKAATGNERVLAQSFMRNSFGAATDIAAGPNPDVALLDMLVLISLQTHVFETHWIPRVWGETRGRTALQRLKALEQDMWARSSVLLSGSQQQMLRRLVDTWIRSNPDRLVVELTRFNEFANARNMPNLSDREEATGLLSDVGNAVTAIDDALLFGERAMWYAGRLSYILGEQTELTTYRVMATPEVKDALETLQGFEKSAAGLSKTAEQIPALLKAQQDQAFEQLRSERIAAIHQIDEVFRATLESTLNELVDDVKIEREAVINHFFTRLASERAATMQSIEAGSGRINELLLSAKELVVASTELARLTNETTSTIERLADKIGVKSGEGAGEDNDQIRDAIRLAAASQDVLSELQALLKLPQFDQRLEAVTALSTTLIDRIFLYIGGIVALLFVGLGVLRFVR